MCLNSATERSSHPVATGSGNDRVGEMLCSPRLFVRQQTLAKISLRTGKLSFTIWLFTMKGNGRVPDLKEIEVLIANVLNEDAALAERHRAFGQIVARFQDLAFGYAYAILNDFFLAEDAAQEAFFVTWQKLDQLKDPRAFPGWFKRVVFSECNRLIRGKRLQVMPLETELNGRANGHDPQAEVEQDELTEQVGAAIRALPDHERQVTTLFYIGGYSQQEIADFLGLQVTTVGKRLFSARRRLKVRLIGMFEDDLKRRRPSRHGAFVDRVQARLRPFMEQDWHLVTSIADGIKLDCREDRESWLRQRQQFDESRYIRRHYVGEHAESGQILGYGSVEQSIFLPNYRLELVVAPEYLRRGVGDLLLDRLMNDLREVNAITVWHRNDARLTDTLDFLKDRGFAETTVVWDLRLPVAELDAQAPPFQAGREIAQGISISTFAEERDRDRESLRKLCDLLNHAMADEPGNQPFAPVPLETVARWCGQRSFLPDACFIARQGERYIGVTTCSLHDDLPGSIRHGFTGVAREYRRQGIATALKRQAIAYARRHGYPLIRAFNHHRNLPILALNEKLGFARHASQVTLEKWLKEVQAVDHSVYDAYVGQYAFDRRELEKYGLPTDLTVAIKRVETRLISEIRDMQDELLPESETRFFIKMHYGEVEFQRNKQGRVARLIYRESDKEMHAEKIA